MRRDICKRLKQIISESMLHVVGQDPYVDGVAGCCRGKTLCVWRECLQGQTGINTGCSRTKQLSRDSAGEARKDGIRR